MKKFEVKNSGCMHYISNGDKYLHSGGDIYPCCEYFPTYEQAQAVLDKFQPKHVWNHGDVFKSYKNEGLMFYVCPNIGPSHVFYLNRRYSEFEQTDTYLDNATFLFNIKDKL